MKTYRKLLLLLLCTTCLVLSSCKKKSEDPTPEEESNNGKNVPMGRLLMHLHNYIEDAEMDAYNITYTTLEGRKISLSMGQIYLSNFQLIKLDGSVYTIPNVVVLKEQESETYTIADVPAGNYKTIRFNIGLDSATNHKNPSNASDPLNKSSMWFSGTAQPDGYIFANIQGKIDTTTDAIGTFTQMQPFKYLIGTNINLKQRTMPDKNFTIVPNQAEYAHMYIDYSKLFNGIKLNDSANLRVGNISDNTSSIAKKIANNLPGIFYYED